MALDPESLYRQLGQLVAETPADLAGPVPLSPESLTWLGRASALIGHMSNAAGLDVALSMDQISFDSAVQFLSGPSRQRNAHQVVAILHRALARAELNAPAAAQGAFIAAGAGFTAFQVVGKVLKEAATSALIVDPYMNSTVLTDFAPLAPSALLCIC